ncbi:MAG: hypothetical protein AAF492_08355, partial [Verrucomicrobiota bacterium]
PAPAAPPPPPPPPAGGGSGTGPVGNVKPEDQKPGMHEVDPFFADIPDGMPIGKSAAPAAPTPPPTTAAPVIRAPKVEDDAGSKPAKKTINLPEIDP